MGALHREVECPACGFTMDPRGFAAHEGGLRCRARVERAKAEQLGYGRIEYTRTHIVKKCGVPCIEFYAAYVLGRSGHCGTQTKEWWSPLWVPDFFKKYYTVGVSTFTGYHRFSWTKTKELFTHAAKKQGESVSKRVFRAGDFVWIDDNVHRGFHEPPEPWDINNGYFGLLTGITNDEAPGSYCVVEVFQFKKRFRGGGRICAPCSVFPAHWTFIGPVALLDTDTPVHFLGSWERRTNASRCL